MPENKILQIENTFRTSNDTNELFDAFIDAMRNNIKDPDLYKILLANPALSKDELIMYTEKLCKELNEDAYEICLWTAGIFENNCEDYDCLNNAIKYYEKAIDKNPQNHKPFLNLIELYNTDFEVPSNQYILEIVHKKLDGVRRKSKVYYALAGLYKKLGNVEQQRKYFSLAERCALRENQ